MSYGSGGAVDPAGNPIGPGGFQQQPSYGGLLAGIGGFLSGDMAGQSLAIQRQMAAIAAQRANALEQSLVQSRAVGNQVKQGNLADRDQTTGALVGLDTAKTGQITYKDSASALQARDNLVKNNASDGVLNSFDATMLTSLPPDSAKAYQQGIPSKSAPVGPPAAIDPMTGQPVVPGASATGASPNAPSPTGPPPAVLPPVAAGPVPLAGSMSGVTPPMQTATSDMGPKGTPVSGTLALPGMVAPVPLASPGTSPVQAQQPAGTSGTYTPPAIDPNAPAATTTAPQAINPTGPTYGQATGAFLGTPAQIAAEAARTRGLDIRSQGLADTENKTKSAEEIALDKTMAGRITNLANGDTGAQAHEIIADQNQLSSKGFDPSWLPPIPGTPNPNAPGGYNQRVSLNPLQVGEIAQGNLANTNALWRPIVDQANIAHQKTQDSQGAQRLADAESSTAFNQNIAGQHLDLESARVNLEKTRQLATSNPVMAAAHLDSNLATYSNDLYSAQNGANKLNPVKYVNPTTGATSSTDPGNGQFNLNPQWSSAETGRAQHIAQLKQQIADTQALRNTIVTPGTQATPPSSNGAPPPILPPTRGTAVPGSAMRAPGSNTPPPAIANKIKNPQYRQKYSSFLPQ